MVGQVRKQSFLKGEKGNDKIESERVWVEVASGDSQRRREFRVGFQRGDDRGTAGVKGS
jgi:hypothetical protein